MDAEFPEDVFGEVSVQGDVGRVRPTFLRILSERSGVPLYAVSRGPTAGGKQLVHDPAFVR
jgi:hypothetical protein